MLKNRKYFYTTLKIVHINMDLGTNEVISSEPFRLIKSKRKENETYIVPLNIAKQEQIRLEKVINEVPISEHLSTLKSETMEEETCLINHQIKFQQFEEVNLTCFVVAKEIYNIKKEVEDDINIKTELLHEECDLSSIKNEFVLDWTQQSHSDKKPKNSKSKNKNDKNKYSCLVCRKDFENATTGKNHLNIHFNKGLVICSLCGGYFKNKILFVNHWYQHFVKKHKFRSKKFKKTKLLVKNVLECNGNIKFRGDKQKQTFVCEICSKQFSLYGNLRRHMRLHNGDTPSKCDVCLKHFLQETTYINHMSIHTDKKPFKCDVCLKPFSRKGILLLHLPVHTGKNLSSVTFAPNVLREMVV